MHPESQKRNFFSYWEWRLSSLSTLEAEAEGKGIQGQPESHDSPLPFKARLFNFTRKETDSKITLFKV